MYGTWWSLVPPVLAITLAFITKEVYISLFCGVLLGALFTTGFHPWNTFDCQDTCWLRIEIHSQKHIR